MTPRAGRPAESLRSRHPSQPVGASSVLGLVLGLVLGIAFRDISENFLASLFLSIQHPFRTGDLVEVAGVLGYVQRTTVRSG